MPQSRAPRPSSNGARAARPARSNRPGPVALSPAQQGGPVTPGSFTDLAGLQRDIGNRAMQRVVATGASSTPPQMPSNARGPLRALPLVTSPIQPRTVKPAMQPARAAASTINRSLIQLKRTMVTSDTTSRIRTSDMTGDVAKDLKSVKKGKKGTSYKRAQEVELTGAGDAKTPDGSVAWYRIGAPQNKEFIKATKVLVNFSDESAFNNKTRGGGNTPSVVDGTLGGIAEISNAVDDPLVETGRRQDLEVEKWKAQNPGKDPDTEPGAPSGASTGLTRLEGGVWLTAGIFGMAVSIKNLADDDKSAWEKIDAAISLMGSTAGVIGSISQIVGTHLEDGSSAQENAKGFGSWGLGYQEMFAGLAAGVKTVKAVVDLVKMIVDEDKHSSSEWVRATGALLKSGLETAKGVLRSIRQISETLGGSVTEQFAQVLPGLDIAIAAVKSIVQGYYLIVSAIAWHRMSALKKDLAGQDPEKFKEARKSYKHDSARVAQLEAMVQEKNAKIAKARSKLAKEKNPKTKAALQEKIDKLIVKRDNYAASKKLAEDTSNDTETQQTLSGGPDRTGIEEYDLATSLETDNKRRVVRQTIHIISNLVAIAASIASLVSGPGAPGAIALKAAAIGIDTSLPFFRWIKQQGRNMASRNEAKGEEGLTNKIFNADKSDTAKLADRKKQAVVMLKMIAKLNPLIDQASTGDPQAETALKAQGKRIKVYLKASGVSTNELFALNGKPEKQVLLLVKAMAQRELDE